MLLKFSVFLRFRGSTECGKLMLCTGLNLVYAPLVHARTIE